MTYRYFAERIAGPNAGQILHRDLPLHGVTISDAQVWWLKGTVTGGVQDLKTENGDPLLETWSTAIWAIDESNQIQGGGILTSLNPETGDMDCMGYGGYPAHTVYVGKDSWVAQDPAQVFRILWWHVQTYWSNLNVQVDGTTTELLVGTTNEPYTLSWWEFPNIGEALTSLADLGFEWREEHSINEVGVMTHRIRIGVPRLGAQQNNLRFISDENIITQEVDIAAADYASHVYVLGPGEGEQRMVGRMETNTNRLKLAKVEDKASLATQSELTAYARRLWNQSQIPVRIKSITVLDHPNAPVGSWAVGDLIMVKLRTPSYWIDQWCRVVSTEIRPESSSAAVITLGIP